MPTYEYKCSACNHAFERFQSMSAEPVKRCPECGKLKVKRLLGTGAGLIFKGSGFYITDYRSESYQKAAKSDAGGGESKPETPASTGGESKPSGGEAKPAASTPEAAKPAAPAKKDPPAKSSSKKK